MRVTLSSGWVDPGTGEAEIDGRARELTPRELDLFRVLVAHAGQTLSREVLRDRVWGESARSRQVVDVTMLRLRGKIERDPAEPIHLVTVHGEGYRLELPERGDVLDLGEASLDLSERTWRTEGATVQLSTEEARLLRALAEAEGAAVDRAALQVAVWGPLWRASLDEVDYVVHRLRKKIEPDPTAPRWVRARSGGGYWLDVPDAAAHRARTNVAPPEGELIGRRTELEAVRRALSEERLVFVTGPGGAGKTRLARQIALEALADGDEAWLCDLGGARAVQAAVATTLSVPEDALVHALEGRGPVLLLLDDADEATEACVELARSCPDVRVLATSRVRPEGVPVVALQALPEQDAARLFVERVHEVDPSWDAEVHDADVRALVGVLDGLPLAVELAAALAPKVSPARQLERAPHDALAGTIRRSWDKLDPRARQVFAQLSVFPASFSLDAVEAVVRVEGPVLPVLHELHRCSLVHDGDAPGRFALYATLRAFAAARLDDGGAARDRHRSFFDDRARAWVLAVKARRDPHAKASLQREVPDLLAAGTPWCVLAVAYIQRGRASAAQVERLHHAIEQTEAPDLRGRLLVERAIAHHHTGDTAAARRDLDAAVAIEGLGQRVDDDVRLACAALAQFGGRWDEALAWLDSMQTDNPVVEAERWSIRGVIEAGRGRHAQAEDAHQRSAAAYEALGMLEDRANQLYNLSVLRVLTGRPARALGTLDLVVAAHRRSGNDVLLTHASTVLGSALHEVGDLPRAEATLREALGLARRLGNRPYEARVLQNLGTILRARGLPDEALELHQRAWELHRAAGNHGAYLALLNIAADAISAGLPDVARDALDRARTEGAGTVRVVVGAHCLYAMVHGLWGTAEEVEASVRAALELAPEHGAGRDEGRVLAQTVAAFADVARARAGDEDALDRVREALAVEPPAGFQMVRWARSVLGQSLSR